VWRVNSGTADTNFLSVLLWLEARRVYSSLEAGFFAVAWLEAGTVFTLSNVDLSTFVSAALRTFDVDSGIVVMMSAVWKLDVDVGCGMLGWSSFLADVNIFPAARTVVMFLFTSDVDLFLELLVAGREIGGERGLTFPSDALLLW